jgi:acetolactate synthase-1/3 small subunit
MKKMVLSMVVENTSGVLSRVAGLFSRRGYNIDSLTVGVTENPKLSRMTVVAKGDSGILEQIRNQLNKLEDVKEIEELVPEHSVCRELVLVRVGADNANRKEVMALTDIFRARIVDVASDSVLIELTGNQAKIDAFIKLLGDFKVLEFVRTGITGLNRGAGAEDDYENTTHSGEV